MAIKQKFAIFAGVAVGSDLWRIGNGKRNGQKRHWQQLARITTTDECCTSDDGSSVRSVAAMAVGARVPAVIASSYGGDKVFGASDKEAAMSTLTWFV